ncbi:agmatine deiminase family protein [Streptomyces kanamyceticus]|uniref:Agmatine deiminase family protein n=1 Tax=Streptomyces kanamyceticus TaxID=1967 RepID=Q1EQF5_STRKN|nr:agmatine deiminase family protein [Streptomyces kanamyceticus]QEU90588.1 agmatine deiminase family protein [Streptomyces kanamyceticus]BAE95565.1 putative agmatine deiminase [Streptomyces kanamyceticus]
MNDHPTTPRHKRPSPSRRTFLTAAAAATAGAALVGAEAWAGSTPGPRGAARAGSFAVPAEDVRHTKTWMAWPDSSAIWGRQLGGVQADIALIARTVAKHEPVTLCANPASAAKARSLCGSSVEIITSVPVDDCWMRDSGPVFRTDGAGGLDAVGLHFNGWGGKQQHAKDARVAERIAALAGVRFTGAGLVGEGGAIEQDGAGTLMATRSSLLNGNRNPGMSEAHLTDAMCEAYGADQVIWFDGVRGQDITDDHVDATSRFLASGRALVQWPLDADDDAYAKDARAQFRVLSAATNAEGQPIAATKLQGPDYDKIRSRDPKFLASYANYYLCNDAVICAHFGDSTADAAAKAALARLYPGRTVEQIDIDRLGAGGGGIHCVTQQQPAP